MNSSQMCLDYVFCLTTVAFVLLAIKLPGQSTISWSLSPTKVDYFLKGFSMKKLKENYIFL